jgi:hypothetical protein
MNPFDQQPSIKEQMQLSNHDHNMTMRSWFGKAFVIMYFLFFLSTVLIWIYSTFNPSVTINNMKEMIMTISALFSGPIGLVIGYYFGGDRDKPY